MRPMGLMMGKLHTLPNRLLFLFLVFTTLAVAEEPKPVDVYVGGEEGYFAYRIPALISSQTGTLLAFCEGRKTSLSDDGNNDLVLRRSTDLGRTWQKMQLVHEEGGDAEIQSGTRARLSIPPQARSGSR